MANQSNNLQTHSEFRLSDYVKARASEMEAMASTAARPDGVKKGSLNSAARQVPVHMRRRAASHNLKRLPRRLRQKAIAQMKDVPKATKMPSRKHRRRPKNLMEEYNRRKRNKVWLETHIWHAKRFHMIEKWGYKIANYANDKGARACYRASAQYCQLWDVSYLCCIELVGTQDELIEGLHLLTSDKTDSSIGSLLYISGSVEGRVCLYQRTKYPFDAIGPVSFQWKPLDSPFCKSLPNNNRTLWIWCHPSIHQQIVEELIAIFTLHREIHPGSRSTNSDLKKDDAKHSNCIYKKLPKIPQDIFQSETVVVTILKDALCRFKLRGPLSHTILTDTLLAADVSGEIQQDNKIVQDTDAMQMDSDLTDQRPTSLWWKSPYTRSGASRIHQQQVRLCAELKKLSSTDHLPAGLVLGLTARDPRLFLPKKKGLIVSSADVEQESSEDGTGESLNLFHWPDVSHSALWECSVRDNVKDTMWTDQQINQKRAENLIPGSVPHLGDKESRIPVLAIHMPPHHSSKSSPTSDYGAGWDLIVPGGWGMPFLIAMVYRGARVGGLCELYNSDFEMTQLHFPSHFPDTDAGKQYEVECKSTLETTHNKRPPAKRVTFEKLGILEPFHNPWKCLISEWEAQPLSDGNQFSVLRDQMKLECLQRLLCGSSNTLPSFENTAYLIPVKLDILSRGCCDSMSSVCIPTLDDIEQLKNNPTYSGPTEPIKSVSKSGVLIAIQKEKVVDPVLNLQTGLRKHCSREVIGFVAEGRFSFKMGQGMGLGFVVLAGLQSAVEKKLPRSNSKLVVLVRSSTSFQYRFVTLSVLL